MADQLARIFAHENPETAPKRRFRDMGDGTFAEVVWDASPDAAGGGAAALQANVHKPVNLAISAEATVWTPAAGKRYRFMGGVIGSSQGGNITFRDGVGGTDVAVVKVAAGGSYPVELGDGILSGAIDRPLRAIHSAGTGDLVGTLQGREE